MSTKEKPIHYEPHPVSPERKAELIAKGVRIVDAVFDPSPNSAKAETSAKREKPVQVEVKQKSAGNKDLELERTTVKVKAEV